MSVGALWFLILALAAIPATAAEKAHVHGRAGLDVAIEGSQLTLEFEAPLEDLVGFEREARNEQRARGADAGWSPFSNPDRPSCQAQPRDASRPARRSRHRLPGKGTPKCVRRGSTSAPILWALRASRPQYSRSILSSSGSTFVWPRQKASRRRASRRRNAT